MKASWPLSLSCALTACLALDSAHAEDAAIVVRADKTIARVSRHMTGVCIEDVNHELYGGIYSQMVFGESFQEPPSTSIEGFHAYGKGWALRGDALRAPEGDGPKLVADRAPFAAGEARVQVRFAPDHGGLAGLILKVSRAGDGADNFVGYEVSLDPSRQVLLLGRHRNNWEPIREVPCPVPVDRWIDLAVAMTETGLKIRVDGKPVFEYEDREHPLRSGTVGIRSWQRETDFRNLAIETGGKAEALAFRMAHPDETAGVSGMWRGVRRGGATGTLAIESDRPFVGRQAQRIAFESGEGALGLENRGLNRRGMAFAANEPYEGILWARADAPARLYVAAEGSDGRSMAETIVAVEGSEWKRYDFALTPTASVDSGRLSITLKAPGSVVLGYVSLQPGPWGRCKDQPTRKDVAEGIIKAGVTVMRLGGSMINADTYRWKNMIGPRDRRQPHKGTWYPYSSNGWGIFEFLGFCGAAGILPIVDLNIDETPQDILDFLAYTNGPADGEWGRRRAEDGHPEPYGLTHLELGNEEAVDEAYWNKFRALAEAIWAADPKMTLIVGDFEYRNPIVDPLHFDGAPRITSLAAHKKILDLAKARGRQVWFDVHIWNDRPREARGRLHALATLDAALAKLSPGADYRIAVFEENANNHTIRRAVAHGETVNALMRMGDRVPVVCAANALQPDGQNDNGWDQGFVFLDQSKVWLQPQAYVTEMISRNYLPQVVEAVATGAGDDLDVAATRSEDGGELVVQVTNVSDKAHPAAIRLAGFTPTGTAVDLEELTGPLDGRNSAADPTRIQVRRGEEAWRDGRGTAHTFPPFSFTTLRLRGKLSEDPSPAKAASVRPAQAPAPLTRVAIDDPFWSPRLALWRKVTLPDVLNKLEKDGALRNFEAVRDGKKAKHGGPPWEDGLLYETMRAASDFLAISPDPELDARLDRIIALVAAAQAKGGDGYINTWTQLEVPDQRWGFHGGNDVWQHDLYNAGGLIEAAVHHARATGKASLLEVALRLIDRMKADIGPAPKHPQIPGHALIEMALVELHELLRGDPALARKVGMEGRADEPLKLAEMLIDLRGHHEGRVNFGAYDQDHEPVERQSTAEGHAVRATLFYAGLTEAALAGGRPEYLGAADRIWANMDGRKTHVTGGVGAHADQEKFGRDDELPNTAYLETCASVGAAAFHRAMLEAHADAKYADALERTLYNGTLGGVGFDGDSYFYVNPLRGGKDVRRWDWHDCPCCPPMFLKQMAMLPSEIYAADRSTLYVNQFIGNRGRLDGAGGPVEVDMISRYLQDGTVRLTIRPDSPRRFTLAVRVPSWSVPPAADALYRVEAKAGTGPRFALNGKPLEAPPIVHGYARIDRDWEAGSVLEVAFPMGPARIHANPRVKDLAGQVALARGPILYLFEGLDNGGSVGPITLPAEAAIREAARPDLPGGLPALEARVGDHIYTAIPFYARANRAPTDFTVWVPESGLR
ncbi:Non-reducing end beta-L-arabinofuranosidase [Aquisphaera giovannonii]|uniref:non-reducing end alpha-L-arabinofuranosidase n=1 Tax=Aquisphaera giovannonii TaxID=406548 RepID=A0A5B9VVQ4_9BACT|nr:beta-L-arabinofuranosidase domain-containing protein [Aquisphaera giovannonii]QEH31941.1 Non-reducing end beta-L-arabinofuranosidase [Aquisphaera giovannonii]